MRGWYYKVILFCTRLFGPWVFAILARPVAVGYFLFSGRVKGNRRFYAVLYPNRSRLYHLWCVFMLYQNFTTVHFNRLLLGELDRIPYTYTGGERLREAMHGQGGILLMSHLGNWELAAHLLRRQEDTLKLMLYMGAKEKEQIVKVQKESLRDSGIKIVAVDRQGGSPFDLVEGIRFLRSGGLVSMTGDRLWQKEQRSVAVKFLGHDLLLPETPYVFAMLAEVPLFAFFTFRTDRKSYHIELSKPIRVAPASRRERQAAIQVAAQRYADLLEAALREHPLEWYHFDPFLEN